MIERVLRKTLLEKFGKGKAILLIGPRQVGKTTLIYKVLENKEFLFLNGDDPTVRTLLTNVNTQQLKNIIADNKIIFIDEAQRIENIGITLKLITDQFKDVQLIVSGSSAFELNNLINEPLTGRKWEYHLYPISWEEFENKFGYLQSEQQLELRLRFGMYPDVINNTGDENEVLNELVRSYLYKDILAFGGIRKPEILEKLLKALALQVGSEVNYNELSRLIGVSKNTVNSYIDLLVKGYVIFKLPSFSKNLRTEIRTNQKIYFYDNGVRNAIIGNFNPLDLRTDVGLLWENFLISERIKKNAYYKLKANHFFWRTKQQQEIDFIEETNNQLKAFEFKWKPTTKIKIPKTFTTTYNTDVKIIDRSNFREFVS
jgi:predicted AAA+ superfamily ATPase